MNKTLQARIVRLEEHADSEGVHIFIVPATRDGNADDLIRGFSHGDSSVTHRKPGEPLAELEARTIAEAGSPRVAIFCAVP